MHAVRNIVAALNRLVQPPSPADHRMPAGCGAFARRGAVVPRPRSATPAGASDPAEESAYARAGTEPCLDEMLRDPIVQLVIRADRLEPADVRGVLDAARHSGAPCAGDPVGRQGATNTAKRTPGAVRSISSRP